MSAPTQQMLALASAQERRMGVAEFRRNARRLGNAGAARKVADALANDYQDTVMGSARIRHLLMCIPRMGVTSVDKCLRTAGVANGDRRLRELTPRQRDAVALQLRFWAETRP